MAFIEYPKWLYQNGACVLMVNDKEEETEALANGYELPPSTEPPPAPCEGCADREAKIADLESQLAALVAKRNRNTPPPPPTE